MVGNYINLPYFGSTRPFLGTDGEPYDARYVLPHALDERQGPDSWVTRARTTGAKPPAEREATRDFGTAKHLHRCAEYMLDRRESNPLRAGHRNVVLFNLAKMLLNWRELDATEAWELLDSMNQAGERPLSRGELERLFENVQNRGFTSTGCDDPLMQPYVDPSCPIAKGCW
jgi:hypothetical protein